MVDVLGDLNTDQVRAATEQSRNLVILAGAGCGKTRTIAHRIAHQLETGQIKPSQTLSLSFTTKAAGELRQRLRSLGVVDVSTRTIHSAAVRQLRYFWPDYVGGSFPKIKSSRDILGAVRPPTHGHQLGEVEDQLNRLRSRMQSVADYEAKPGEPTRELIQQASQAVDEYKAAHNVVDYDDILLITLGLLRSQAAVRATVEKAYRWFFVDEIQDITPLQEQLLLAWVGERGSLTVVGDRAQSLYDFAGADPAVIGRLAARQDAVTVNLATGYRCAPEITAAANRLATHIPGSLQLRPHRESRGSMAVLKFPTWEAELAGIAGEIKSLVTAGGNPNEIACLLRTNDQVAQVSRVLAELDVPVATRFGDRFYDRPEAHQCLIRLRGLARANPQLPADTAMAEVLLAMPGEQEDTLRAIQGLAVPGRTVAELVAVMAQQDEDSVVPAPNAVSVLTIHSAKGLEWSRVFLLGMADGQFPRPDDDELAELRTFYVACTRAADRLVMSWSLDRGRSPSPFLRLLDSTALLEKVEPTPTPTVLARRPTADVRQGKCRVCGKLLVTGREVVLGRCLPCPGGADAETVAKLQLWREVGLERGLRPKQLLSDDAVLALAELPHPAIEQIESIPGTRKLSVEDARQILQILNPPQNRVPPGNPAPTEQTQLESQ